MMNNLTDTVKHLIILNIIFFVGSMYIGEDVARKFLALFYVENSNFGYWQFVSYMFMHGGFMHILFNMYALFAFGSALEQFWGGQKFLFFYLSCGIGAALIHTGVNYYHFEKGVDFLMNNGFTQSDLSMLLSESKYNLSKEDLIYNPVVSEMLSALNIPAVGASGAIYGILVAFAFMFPHAELMLLFIPFPIKAKYFVPGLLAMDLFSGLTGQSIFGGGIAHFAHIGGALFGFLIMWYWKKNQFNSNRWN